jgi:hypothetical protein
LFCFFRAHVYAHAHTHILTSPLTLTRVADIADGVAVVDVCERVTAQVRRQLRAVAAMAANLAGHLGHMTTAVDKFVDNATSARTMRKGALSSFEDDVAALAAVDTLTFTSTSTTTTTLVLRVPLLR